MALFGSRSDPEFNWSLSGMQSSWLCPALDVACQVSHREPGFAIPVLVGVILPCPGLVVSVVLITFHRSGP